MAKRDSVPEGWGAALMWSVDCVANAMDGEPLLDISREDFLLGLIVWAGGLAAFGVLYAVDRKRELAG